MENNFDLEIGEVVSLGIIFVIIPPKVSSPEMKVTKINIDAPSQISTTIDNIRNREL